MRLLIPLVFLSLIGCGERPDPRTVTNNPVFQPYVDFYISKKGAQLSYDIPIAFAKLEGNKIGRCTKWSYGGYRQIQIDEVYWNYADEPYRIALIFHELGHCDLNRKHTNDMNSIMWLQNLGSSNYEELFMNIIH